jgi:hypothetical protein
MESPSLRHPQVSRAREGLSAVTLGGLLVAAPVPVAVATNQELPEEFPEGSGAGP